jgi:hypothetical protein
MKNPIDFSTPDILQSELDGIHEALFQQQIGITEHAEFEADTENIPLVSVFEAILVGTAVGKDLPGNALKRVPGINFEHKMNDGRWIRLKVAWIDNYLVITVHTI